MAIDTSSSSMSVTSAPTVGQNSQSVSSKTSSDSSFKDEMDKVTTAETKNEDKKEVSDTKNEKDKVTVNENKKDNVKAVENKENKDDNDITLSANLTMNNINIGSFSDINQMLVDDIEQMANVNGKLFDWSCTNGENKFSLSMNEADAKFFIDLANSNDISTQNIVAQAQNMLNSGANAREVHQSYQVSQTLLNALNEARQNNQPIRIDFDQNVAVILRVNQNGSLSANFIPGDKAVEQFLRQNIDMLRNSFDEKNLPYTELSYSNSSKEQNKRRRNEQQQGE